MLRYQISHRTMYTYGAPVIQSHHLLHLSPREVANQNVRHHGLIIEPTPAVRSDRVDAFENPMTFISMETEHTALNVNAISDIDVTEAEQPDFEASPPWESVAQRTTGRIEADVLEFTCQSHHTRPSIEIYDFAKESFPQGTPVLAGARHLMERIFTEFRFDNAATDISTPVVQVLAQKSGVCQDFAHLQIAALRSFGLPARYISGYILTHPPEGQVKLEGSDASHAWVSVWSPDTGWVDFDPTNNLVNSPEHITIAHGRDFEDVSPISGVLLGGGSHAVSVAVDVKPAG